MKKSESNENIYNLWIDGMNGICRIGIQFYRNEPCISRKLNRHVCETIDHSNHIESDWPLEINSK